MLHNESENDCLYSISFSLPNIKRVSPKIKGIPSFYIDELFVLQDFPKFFFVLAIQVKFFNVIPICFEKDTISLQIRQILHAFGRGDNMRRFELIEWFT